MIYSLRYSLTCRKYLVVETPLELYIIVTAFPLTATILDVIYFLKITVSPLASTTVILYHR